MFPENSTKFELQHSQATIISCVVRTNKKTNWGGKEKKNQKTTEHKTQVEENEVSYKHLDLFLFQKKFYSHSCIELFVREKVTS